MVTHGRSTKVTSSVSGSSVSTGIGADTRIILGCRRDPDITADITADLDRVADRPLRADDAPGGTTRGHRRPSIRLRAVPVSYTHLRAHETDSYLVCRLLLEKKK